MSICLAITDADWTLTKDVVGVIGTAVSAIGVFLVARVGFLGLATWERQIKGTSDHELSRRLLIDLYRLRDSISHVRNPVMLGSEGAEDEPEKLDDKQSFIQITYRRTVRAYINRLTLVDDVCTQLKTSLLESEAVWDIEAKKLFEPIFKLRQELLLNVRTYLIATNPDGQSRMVQTYSKLLDQRRDVLYESPLEGDDAFKTELDAALANVENYLKTKMIRKSSSANRGLRLLATLFGLQRRERS